MSEMAPTSAIFQVGAKRLALLGKHHQVLMSAYVEGQVPENAVSELALKKLIDARILWRPSPDQPLMLRPLMSELIASMIADENRRQINADVADKLEQLRHRVGTYRRAEQQGDYAIAELQLQRLTEQVHDLSGQFAEAIDSLWHRLNSDFGFVATLEDKIRENERAQSQLRRLLDGLELIDFEELIGLCEGSNGLRKLLVSQLQMQLSAHHSSLLEVQKRLVELLAKFRQQQSRSLLIANTVAFLRQHPGYRPLDYPNRSELPRLFNVAEAIIPAAAIALDRSSDQVQLAEIVKAVPRSLSAEELSAPASIAGASLPVNDAVALRQQALKAAVEQFYLDVAQSGKRISALDYLTTHSLSWDSEMWLYQIIAEYQSLPRHLQRHLELKMCEQKASADNDLRLIEDLLIKKVV
ncbi:hypothetical protein [Celerinatantimonas sp. YJH-8]|uniref:hypothetical protein n=1 Tax=Celerinatantimonas sp. YJH-8 TaxID=3228714 RepID=UPI0038CBCDD8